MSRPDYIQSLERGLSVIRAFSAERPALTLSEIARETGLTRAAARRFLITLDRLGYVTCAGRSFELTPKILELGYAYLSSTPYWELIQPHVEVLAEKLQESSSVAVLDGHDVVYVLRVPTKRIMTIRLTVGSRLPAWPTSLGRVLLAALRDDDLDAYLARVPLRRLTARTICDPGELRAVIRQTGEQGWALVDQELEEGVRSVAAPVRDRSGKVIAAVNVSAHATRATLDRLRNECLPCLLTTAEHVTTELSVR
jgi:IclR family pca regulon transcriptional regulator